MPELDSVHVLYNAGSIVMMATRARKKTRSTKREVAAKAKAPATATKIHSWLHDQKGCRCGGSGHFPWAPQRNTWKVDVPRAFLTRLAMGSDVQTEKRQLTIKTGVVQRYVMITLTAD